MKTYTLSQVIDLIHKEILGVPKYGFEDEEKWAEFIKSNFTREGMIDGEKYSSQLNQVLSACALTQTLSEIRKRMSALIEREAED